jgi:hypothetical protein
MGIFFVSHQPVVPEVNSAIRTALLTDPATLGNVEQEAAQRTLTLIQATAPQFSPSRFAGAFLISCVLLVAAIWTAKHNLPDISKDLMQSFAGFSGIVLGLLGGEAQKFSSA